MAALILVPVGSGCECGGASGAVDGGTDAGTDAGQVDAGPPPRHLVHRSLLYGLPAENRMVDPTLSEPTYAWQAYADSEWLAPIREEWTDTPTRAPVLTVGQDRPGEVATLLGMGRGGKAPLVADIWVSTQAVPGDVMVGILGLDVQSARDKVFTLEPGEVVSDEHGRTWQHFSATVDQDLPGIVYLWVQGTLPFRVHAPVLLSGVPATGIVASSPPPVTRGRPLPPRVARLVRAFEDRLRQAPPPAVLRRRQAAARRARLEAIARALRARRRQ